MKKFVIGEAINNAGFSALDVAAVLVYDKELNDTEHSQTLEYLTQKYLTVPAASTSRVAQSAMQLEAAASGSIAATTALSEPGNAEFSDGIKLTANSDRITEDLVALYLFDEGDGTRIRDTSGVGKALNLSIDDPTSVTWGDGTLTLEDPTLIFSDTAANKLTDALTGGAITLEAWFTSDSLTQGGLAPIVTLLANTGDATLSLFSPEKAPDDELTHLIYTQETDGSAALYLNGALVASGIVEGDLFAQTKGHQLVLGNELGSNPAWLGTLDLVAIYGQSFDADEVTQNFLAGPNGTNVSLV